MSKREQTIRHYLLGELPESQQVKLEQEYFGDAQMFEQVVQVENDLVDQYARGLLPPATRSRFEEYYLAHPQRRERARFAETLRKKIEQSQKGVVAGPKCR